MIRLSSVLFKGEPIRDWPAYFNYNKTHLLKLDFARDRQLTESERTLIAPSIKAFQVGEGSNGENFLSFAKQYADDTGDHLYIDAVKAFIAEENRHSKTLGRYMQANDIAFANHSILDRCFRFVRKKMGLKWEIIVLVTAEMIALSYYTVLSKVTESGLLKEICRQMLRDELRHVVFQSQMLAKLRLSGDEQQLRQCLMLLTGSIVWLAFRNVFKAGKYGYRKFMSECMGYLSQSGDIAMQNSY